MPATLVFQSTLPHGERLVAETVEQVVIEFQSTLPHGERHNFSARPSPLSRFNPRSHMGSDRYD